jgi:hypothetical protein
MKMICIECGGPSRYPLYALSGLCHACVRNKHRKQKENKPLRRIKMTENDVPMHTPEETDTYTTETTVDPATQDKNEENMWDLIQPGDEAGIPDSCVHQCFAEETSWWDCLDQEAKDLAEKLAESMVDKYVGAIASHEDLEIGIPCSWMVPDFSTRVFAACNSRNIPYYKTRETKHQVTVMHGTPKKTVDLRVIVIQEKLTRQRNRGSSLYSKASDVLFNAISGNDYYKIRLSSIVSIREELDERLNRGESVALVLDQLDDVSAIQDIARKHGARVTYAETLIVRG